MANNPNSKPSVNSKAITKARLILYIGDDTGYWSNIKQRYQDTYPVATLEFISFFDKDPLKYQNIFVNILEVQPDVIYIDFSFSTKSQLRIAKLLKREPITQNIPVIGLVDSKDLLIQCRQAGVDFLHIKCGEQHDVVYDPYFIKWPKEVRKPDYAMARFSRDAEILEDFQISYITPTSIHVESNVSLTVGQQVELFTNIPKKVVPSNKFIVSKVETTDLYYSYTKAYDLDFVYVDKPDLAQNQDVAGQNSEQQNNSKIAELMQKERIAEYTNELQIAKTKTKNWVLENIGNFIPKKTKILIIDRDMQIFEKESEPIDKYPFTLRFQTRLSSEMDEFMSFRPHIIAFQFYDGPPKFEEKKVADKKKTSVTQAIADKDNKKKDVAKDSTVVDYERVALEHLTNIIKNIRKQTNYNPFVVIFNSKRFNSKTLQESFKYQFILADSNALNLSHVIELARLYEKKHEDKLKVAIQQKLINLRKKDPMKYSRVRPSDFEEKRYYIEKGSRMGVVYYPYHIELQTMTESELTFLSDVELAMSSYKMKYPVEMFIRLVPVEGKNYVFQSGRFLYKALIHSADEDDKKRLRQLVNEVFFTSVNEKRAKEQEEFAKLNQSAMALKKKELHDAEEELADAAKEIQDEDDDGDSDNDNDDT